MDIKVAFLDSKKESKAELPLSVSKAKTFDDCKKKYYFTYIKKFPRKEWDFHVLGKFAHESLERFHNSLLDNPNQDIYDVMNISFKESVSSWQEKLTKEQKDLVWNMMSYYLNKLSSESLPNVLYVERPFYIDIGNKVLLNGFIDIVQKDSDGIIHVADYKTTKAKKYLKDYFQLLTYAYVLMQENPRLKKIRASYILLRHNFEYVTKEYTRSEVLEVQDKLLNYAEEILAEQTWKPSPQFLCKYCDHLDRCSEGTDYLVSKGLIERLDYGASEW